MTSTVSLEDVDHCDQTQPTERIEESIHSEHPSQSMLFDLL